MARNTATLETYATPSAAAGTEGKRSKSNKNTAPAATNSLNRGKPPFRYVTLSSNDSDRDRARRQTTSKDSSLDVHPRTRSDAPEKQRPLPFPTPPPPIERDSAPEKAPSATIYTPLPRRKQTRHDKNLDATHASTTGQRTHAEDSRNKSYARARARRPARRAQSCLVPLRMLFRRANLALRRNLALTPLLLLYRVRLTFLIPLRWFCGGGKGGRGGEGRSEL